MRANHRFLGLVSVLLLCGASYPAAAATGTLDPEALRSRLIGFYRGTAPDPARPGSTTEAYHKIVEVAAPQLGRAVLYHQIARDGFDSAEPLLQKFYVFGAMASGPGVLNVVVYAVKPRSLPGNLEQQPRRLAQLTPSALQTFPASCALAWRAGADTGKWVATPASPSCRYRSATLQRVIVPEFRYDLTPETLAMRDVLRDTQGKALFGDAGTLVASRVPANTTSTIVALSRLAEWRALDPERVLQLELESGAIVRLELAPELAPRAVANIRTLVREKYFDGLVINRVQDNFVAQWGDPGNTRSLGSASRSLPAEFSRDWQASLDVTLLPDPDGYAPQTGFLAGMPVAGDRAAGRIWGAHCYATVGVGRDNDENSGNGSELYVVIGHAPRQLDRNITVVGRVVQGMDALSSLRRGSGAAGFYATPAEGQAIRSVRLVADLPAAQQSQLWALRTDSASFTALIEARRNRRDDWYKLPAGHVDLCNVPLPVREGP
jgi:peptidylprolyl isomerase